MQVAALEVSTSSVKAIRFESEEGILDLATQPYSDRVAGDTTIQPEGMVDAALDVLATVVQSADAEPVILGLCGTWHSLLYLDQNGNPEGPIRTWVDTTGRSFVEDIRPEREWVDSYYRKTGCVAHAMYPFWKHCYFEREGRFEGRSVPLISSQVEYLYQVLTGERGVSRCTASGSGFFQLHSKDWGEDLLDFASVERDQLSPIREETHTAPLRSELAGEIGLPEGTPVTVGAADGAMNQLAVAGMSDEVMSCSVGTSGAIRLGVKDARLPHQGGTWCYYMHDDTYVAGGATHGINNADWYLDILNSGGELEAWDYEMLDEEASQIERSEAPYFLPFLYGERAPGWDEDRTATLAGLTAEHGPGAIYHAIQEGILFTLYDCYRRMLSHWNADPEEVVMSGGILNSERWTQMAADIFGTELSATGSTHDSTVGAAMLAEKAAGEFQFDKLNVDTDVVATPKTDTGLDSVYQKRFRTYQKYYGAGG